MVSKRAKQDIRMKGIYDPKGVSINGSKTVSVFGLGFVGLTTALGFAEIGGADQPGFLGQDRGGNPCGSSHSESAGTG